MTAEELGKLHFTKLQAMLAEKGLEYTGKAAAIALLTDAIEVVAVVVGVYLDRSLPFGEVFGDADGARYAQGNHLFDSNGKVLNGARNLP